MNVEAAPFAAVVFFYIAVIADIYVAAVAVVNFASVAQMAVRLSFHERK